MRTIEVDLGSGRGHRAHVVASLSSAAGGQVVPASLQGIRAVVLADATAAELHGARLREWCSASGFELAGVLEIPSGERSKSFTQVESLLEELAGLEIERRDLVISFGGGVTGDISGVVAGLHRRGVALAHLPTTLLAQVDSCIGGKAAVDLRAGKNLAGLFHQPAFTLAAVDLLETETARHWRAGMAEALKTAILFDRDLFDWIEARHPGQPAELSLDDRIELVHRCQAHKARVVSSDENEVGERRLLNLGHTLGHALETATGHGEALFHGEAVAIGMVYAARLAERRAVAPPGTTNRIRAALEALGLPVEPPAGVDPAVSLALMRQDKKRSRGESIWVLPAAIGSPVIVSGIEDGELLELLR